MFEYATAAVEGALAAGAQYADARVVVSKQESIEVQNQAVESLDRTEQAGVGVRALIGSSWGVFAPADLCDSAATAAGGMCRGGAPGFCGGGSVGLVFWGFWGQLF